MTPRKFNYPRVVLQFYHSMTSRGVPSPLELRFTIDDRLRVLRAGDISAALGLPAELPILEDIGIGHSHHRGRWSTVSLEIQRRDPYSSAGSFHLRCCLWTTCSGPACSLCNITFNVGEPYSRPCTGSQRDSGPVPLSWL